MKKVLFICLLLLKTITLFSQVLSSVEYGATLHTGDNTPLWHTANQHGLSSIKNNTYIRGSVFYEKERGDWNYQSGLDLVAAAGFTSTFVLQQAFVDVTYKKWGVSVGNKESTQPLLNEQLSSGGLIWSGNARPIPQVRVGILDYVRLSDWIRFKAELSYGWFTDNNYQRKTVGENNFYTKDIKYHHKRFYMRIQKPQSRWIFDISASLDAQFGGYRIEGDEKEDLGNRIKDYWKILIPKGEDDKQKYYEGNHMGYEHLQVTYDAGAYSISAYMENYFDDFSGMGKQNGMDGLWGIEWRTNTPQFINGLVLEYYQTTNQSGPLHGLDNSVVTKTGGADDYYNNHQYPGWTHWGMSMANPLIASPIYNKDGNLSFKYNRVKAIHLGWEGVISSQLSYLAKLSYSQTWGTPFKPTINILENYSMYIGLNYIHTKNSSWNIQLSTAFDTGDIYGDNLGMQVKVRKRF
ncbi:hypothetical protein D0T50_08670 [Bacteroides sp. 214]|uniref:capsule assembly Wzi family protein n=1 Tax=Bacteroides sp. 214 TaxID=2302935 RepID=UPI0013D30062|nr:capsule assembly Wzi family protein [Bacteroides sp. 214]NDW12964.1 hypothetical protein [Bacteroides sp. 214]